MEVLYMLAMVEVSPSLKITDNRVCLLSGTGTYMCMYTEFDRH